MSPLARRIAVLALIVTTGPLLADTKPAAPTKEQIAKWIRQLGDADFDVREKASEQIWNATDEDTSPLIEEALKEALKSEDTEIVGRASKILDLLQLGVNAKTPKKIVEMVQAARGKDQRARMEGIKGLLESGGPGREILVKLIDRQKDLAAKDRLAKLVWREASTAIGTRIADGDRAGAEQLLDFSVRTDHLPAHLAYAAYWHRRGKLAERIRGLAASKPANLEHHSALLATLYRVQGDYGEARTAAEESKNRDLLTAILFDEGNWKELAKRPVGVTPAGDDDMFELGLKACYERLAGDAKGADETLARIRKDAPKYYVYEQPTQVLLLNGRPQDVLPVISSGRGSVVAAELYAARGQFAEAFKVFDAKNPVDPRDQGRFEILRARSMYLLGDKEKALNILNEIGKDFCDGTAPGRNGRVTLQDVALLMRTERGLGRKDLTYEQAATLFGRGKGDALHWMETELAFLDQARPAAAWWQYLRHKHPQDEPPETMKRLRTLIEGQVPLKEFTPIVEDAIRFVEGLSEERRIECLLWLADSCRDQGADALEKSATEKAVTAAQAIAAPAAESEEPSPRRRKALLRLALERLADYYMGKNDWSHAAEYYGKEWEIDRTDSLPVYLRGLALVKAGQEMEGTRLIDLAHDLPLADADARHRFIYWLDERGHADAARLERELTIRINGYDEPRYSEEALKSLAQHARAERNYAQAADCYERSLLCHLHAKSGFRQDVVGVLALPAKVHFNRAMAFLTSDKFDEASREIQACLDILPADSSLPITVAPELEKRGHEKEAGDLFGKVWAVHDGLCKDYPKSAWAHNNIAWLAVRCRRNLDEALKHAQQAIDLAPENPRYLDTLAEVYFQKGDKEKALELTKKCIKMEPKYAYFQRQLKRIEAGDPSVDVPE
jgi:tetratricopeptide (TPR) repeat protein